MSHEAIAQCSWFYLINGKWIQEDELIKEPPKVVDCRASVGTKIVTVWLPRGAKIRCRLGIFGAANLAAREFRHTYGRDRDRQIRFKIVDKDSKDS